MKPYLIGLATCVLLLSPGAALAQDKQICEAKLFGKKARLWVEDGQPVRYQWSNRAALSAQMSGNQITIAASPPATLSNVEMGQNGKGQATITGDWKFKTNTQDNVVFTCRPK
ncbi:hypothetical protein EI983_16715 [Roseovarius faecimaris]|uniref:C-type lysozyme inhibitor domain-containing protein n=1 Tax=Roseovarius faecimaris TaxID=2494550 RepID=A0A6I6IW19_9RHOB|nr:hypothetical protein [Roseovarius faecimaris]QGX99821.1 hypothetical protein EI983_16715 [Roseovarius faecimaris]